jgi:hypothetical protein
MNNNVRSGSIVIAIRKLTTAMGLLELFRTVVPDMGNEECTITLFSKR